MENYNHLIIIQKKKKKNKILYIIRHVYWISNREKIKIITHEQENKYKMNVIN